MAKPTLTREQALRKLRFFQLLTGVLFLTLISGLLLYLLHRPQPFNMNDIGEKVYGTVPTEQAKKNMGFYRERLAYARLSMHPGIKVEGVLHDTDDLRSYITDDFKRFTSTHTPKKDYVWQIGVYPMVCKETRDHPNKPRIGFYLIPTMASTNPSAGKDSILDFISMMKTREGQQFYTADSVKEKFRNRPFVDSKFIFDEGHLWP